MSYSLANNPALTSALEALMTSKPDLDFASRQRKKEWHLNISANSGRYSSMCLSLSIGAAVGLHKHIFNCLSEIRGIMRMS